MKSRRREGLGKAKDTSTGKPSEPGRGVRVGEGGGVWRMGLDGTTHHCHAAWRFQVPRGCREVSSLPRARSIQAFDTLWATGI